MSWITGLRNTVQNWYQPLILQTPANKPEFYVEPNKIETLPSREILIDYSIKAFDRFKNVWDFDDFWKRANTCDACIFLVEVLFKQKPQDPEVEKILQAIQEMLEQNLAYFENYKKNDKWVDDLAWWGLMGLNAYNLLRKLDNQALAKKYFDLSVNCWHYIIDHGYDKGMDSKPVAHGCLNNTADLPDEGVKNTVVNATLMLLSTRLYRFSEEIGQSAVDRKPFLDMAYNQWLWFSNWFDYKDNEYLKTFNKGNAGLVGERPLAPNSDYQNTSHPDWSVGWVWTGDQGLLIGGLLDILTLKDNFAVYQNSYLEADVKKSIQMLVSGVKEALIGNRDNIFYEPPCSSSYASYGNDYLCGRGVLVRYMGVQNIKDLLGLDFKVSILETIKAIWSTKDNASNQFKPEFAADQDEYFNQFKNLLGYADTVSGWSIDPTDPKANDAIPQAVGLDFLGAALSLKEVTINI